MYTILPLKEVNMVLFLRNKQFNFMLFWADYYLRWWRLPIDERACRKTDLGGGDYYLRNSGLPPSWQRHNSHIQYLHIILIFYFRSWHIYWKRTLWQSSQSLRSWIPTSSTDSRELLFNLYPVHCWTCSCNSYISLWNVFQENFNC